MLKIVNENYLTTVENILDGYVDNVPDEQIDQDLKMFRKFSKLLNCKWYTHIVVLVDDYGEYSPRYVESAELMEQKPGWKFYQVNGIPVVYEVKNGIHFLYFGNQEDAENYVKLIDGINNQEVTESTSEDVVQEDVEYNNEQDEEYRFPVHYNVYINTIIEDDVDDLLYNDEDSDIREQIKDSYDVCLSEAGNKLFDKLNDRMEENHVEITKRLGINDYQFTFDEFSKDDEGIYAYFDTEIEVDIDLLASIIDKYSNNLSATNKGYSKIVDKVEFYHDTGYETNEVDVEYSVTVEANLISVERGE